uniref:ASPSCR1 tether for SLC2A4, UBX domain containing n=1 Tax=Strix occidentalis caurina TaxID=311401 RepID=A0A8D0G419_STROC
MAGKRGPGRLVNSQGSPLPRSRTVRIALQLDDGSRLQDAFHCQQTLWELLNHFAKISCHNHFPLVLLQISGKDALEKTTLKSLGLTGGSAIIRDVAMSLNSSTDKQDSVRESHASLEELRPSSEPKSTPFVPFFGDGQRLGDSSVAAPSLGLDMPSSKLPTTFSSPGGPSKPKKSKNSQELQKEQEQVRENLFQQQRSRASHMLVEREPLVCHLDLLEPLPAGPEELPDEFFEVTVDDVRKRLAQLQSERKRLEEAPLMTKSLREAQLKEKLERYPKVTFVLFPVPLASGVESPFSRPSCSTGVLPS